MGSFALLAYIDPGSGAILLQVLLASVFTLGIFFRRLLLAPLRLFFKAQPSKLDSSELASPEPAAAEGGPGRAE
jgi:hypothetical protein